MRTLQPRHQLTVGDTH